MQDGRMDANTLDLIAQNWAGGVGEMPELKLRQPLEGVASILDNSKAREVLGIEFHSVRNASSSAAGQTASAIAMAMPLTVDDEE
jgi:hypothetical protein